MSFAVIALKNWWLCPYVKGCDVPVMVCTMLMSADGLCIYLFTTGLLISSIADTFAISVLLSPIL